MSEQSERMGEWAVEWPIILWCRFQIISAQSASVYHHGLNFESAGIYGEAGIQAQMKANIGMSGAAGGMAPEGGVGAASTGVGRGTAMSSDGFPTKPKRVRTEKDAGFRK